MNIPNPPLPTRNLPREDVRFWKRARLIPEKFMVAASSDVVSGTIDVVSGIRGSGGALHPRPGGGLRGAGAPLKMAAQGQEFDATAATEMATPSAKSATSLANWATAVRLAATKPDLTKHATAQAILNVCSWLEDKKRIYKADRIAKSLNDLAVWPRQHPPLAGKVGH